jgi:hypothetical protein
MEVGQPIEGSRFFRAFCCHCGDPIRVSMPGDDHRCHACEPAYSIPAPWENLTQRQRCCLWKVLCD